jgi:hypothetical protein
MDDLRHFKQVSETGEILFSDATKSARDCIRRNPTTSRANVGAGDRFSVIGAARAPMTMADN